MARDLRVAAYCRVSTDKDDQLNSLAAQRRFFQSYIAEHPGWELVEIVADEGLSGTSIRRRPRFAELIRRALAGEIDLIVTKEVSRFARNTVDTLQVTRRLKEKGVGVLFLNDNIDTRDNDGEFRLTIMASVAQEESRKISERTRWGQLQAMKNGVVFGSDSLYGYALRDGRLTVRPEQAEVVRLAFRKCLDEGKGTHVIARELTEAGIRPPRRAEGAWTAGTVLKMLKNEKYCGDLLQKKYMTADYLTHRKVLNHGLEEKILLQDHHEPIVSRETFQAVQAELARRASLAEDKGRWSARYWFSGKVRCGNCGKSFCVKRTKRAGGREYWRFVCRGRLDGGSCGMRPVRGEVIEACARRVLELLRLDQEHIIAEVLREPEALREPCGAGLEGAVRRQKERLTRAQEAYLDGVLGLEDLRRVTARCEAELARLQEQMKRNLESKGPERDLRRELERELAEGGAVLDEAIERITVCGGSLVVEVAEVPVRFRVKAEGRGVGEAFQVVVTECMAERWDS